MLGFEIARRPLLEFKTATIFDEMYGRFGPRDKCQWILKLITVIFFKALCPPPELNFLKFPFKYAVRRYFNKIVELITDDELCGSIPLSDIVSRVSINANEDKHLKRYATCVKIFVKFLVLYKPLSTDDFMMYDEITVDINDETKTPMTATVTTPEPSANDAANNISEDEDDSTQATVARGDESHGGLQSLVISTIAVWKLSESIDLSLVPDSQLNNIFGLGNAWYKRLLAGRTPYFFQVADLNGHVYEKKQFRMTYTISVPASLNSLSVAFEQFFHGEVGNSRKEIQLSRQDGFRPAPEGGYTEGVIIGQANVMAFFRQNEANEQTTYYLLDPQEAQLMRFTTLNALVRYIRDHSTDDQAVSYRDNNIDDFYLDVPGDVTHNLMPIHFISSSEVTPYEFEAADKVDYFG